MTFPSAALSLSGGEGGSSDNGGGGGDAEGVEMSMEMTSTDNSGLLRNSEADWGVSKTVLSLPTTSVAAEEEDSSTENTSLTDAG